MFSGMFVLRSLPNQIKLYYQSSIVAKYVFSKWRRRALSIHACLLSDQIPAERDKITFVSLVKWQLRRNLRQVEGAKLLELRVELEKQVREFLWILSLWLESKR